MGDTSLIIPTLGDLMSTPRPVLTANSVVGVITGAAGLLGTLGFTNAETKLGGMAKAIAALVVFLVILVSHLIAAFHAQEKVTPNSAPRDILGRVLVPLSDAYKAVENAAVSLGSTPQGLVGEIKNDALSVLHDVNPSNPKPAPVSPDGPELSTAPDVVTPDVPPPTAIVTTGTASLAGSSLTDGNLTYPAPPAAAPVVTGP